MIGVGSPVGARRGRGAIAGRPPTPGPHRSIDIAGGGTPETSQNGRGATDECNWGSAMADRPPDDGPGNHCAPRRTPLDNRSMSWADGRTKRQAVAGSPSPWHICQNADMERDAIAANRTQTLGTGDPRPTVGCGQTIG